MTRSLDDPMPEGDPHAVPGTDASERENPKVVQILAAARDLFLSQSYDLVSTDAIARRAGVSKATLYVYFPSKETLFERLVFSQCRTIGSEIWSAGQRGEGVEAVLRTIARNFLRMLVSPDALSLYRAIVAQVPRFPELGRIFYDSGPNNLITRLAEFLRGASDRGEIAVPDPRLAAVQFLQLVSADIAMHRLLGLPPLGADAIDRSVEGGIRVFMAAHRPGSRAG